jgi:hypothetical protein
MIYHMKHYQKRKRRFLFSTWEYFIVNKNASLWTKMLRYKRRRLPGKEGRMLRYVQGSHLLILVQRCFDVNEKKGRCFRLRFKKVESISFVHSKANNSGIKGKATLRGIHKYLQKLLHSITIPCWIVHFLVQINFERVFTDINKRNKSFRSFLQNFRDDFDSSTSTNITLKNNKGKSIEKCNKEKSEIKTWK